MQNEPRILPPAPAGRGARDPRNGPKPAVSEEYIAAVDVGRDARDKSRGTFIHNRRKGCVRVRVFPRGRKDRKAEADRSAIAWSA